MAQGDTKSKERREHDIEQEENLERENRSEPFSDSGLQEGCSRSEHSQASARQDHQPQAPVQAATGRQPPPITHFGGQPIHNRDPRQPHTAEQGSGSEREEEQRLRQRGGNEERRSGEQRRGGRERRSA